MNDSYTYKWAPDIIEWESVQGALCEAMKTPCPREFDCDECIFGVPVEEFKQWFKKVIV